MSALTNTAWRYSWEKSYEAAILETDSLRLLARIKEARAAIHSRIEEMREDHHGTPEERSATACALAWIEVLEKERL